MWAAPPQILRTLYLNNSLCRLVTSSRRILVRSTTTDSLSKQNRRRALEYLQKYSKEEYISHPDDLTPHEELHQSVSTAKPCPKEMARARLRKHIPAVTGCVPTPDQLAQLLESAHGAHNVVVLDVRHKASFADWLLLCCGLTTNHVLAVADGIAQDMRALDVLIGGEIVTVSGRHSSDWMVIDIGSIVIHVMTDEAREHYRLEELWLPERVLPNNSNETFR